MALIKSESRSNQESDDYLIELMGLKEDFPEEAMVAYGEIYSRYWDVMFRVACNVTRDADVAADLLSDTFNMIYLRASTFKKGKIRNPDNVRYSIQKWMTTIMQHIFYDHFLADTFKEVGAQKLEEESYIIDKQYIEKYLSQDYDDFLDQLESHELNEISNNAFFVKDEKESENSEKIRTYLTKLSERDRDIIITVYNYYIPGKYSPTEVLDDLESKWRTSRENIRKVLEKFRKAIKEELQAKIFIRK